ncbi:hypothetical protein R6Q59_009993 [Mikania micrantha]
MAGRAVSEQNLPSLKSWPTRDNIAIFIRCLHLLDLDLLPDWPGLNEQLFSAKSAQQQLQQRVRAVEWSLYRLFEIYDPNETKDKLRPFFPPTSQLQSLNLRAALYRGLTELKKTGALSKDVILRKTMLDDCKGERFEEIIASFAVVTLKKVTGDLAIANLGSLSDAELVSMLIAYRVSLRNNLNHRTDLRNIGKQQIVRLAVMEADLRKRLGMSQAVTACADRTREKQLSSVLHNNWIGNGIWADILLDGIPGEILLGGSSFDHGPASAPRQLLRDLDERIKKQEDRLSKWRDVAKDLSPKRFQPVNDKQTVDRSIPVSATSSRFSKHQQLQLSGWKADVDVKLPINESYQDLISRMSRYYEAAHYSQASMPPTVGALYPKTQSLQTAKNSTEHLRFSEQDVQDNPENELSFTGGILRVSELDDDPKQSVISAEAAELKESATIEISDHKNSSRTDSHAHSVSYSSISDYPEEPPLPEAEPNGVKAIEDTSDIPLATPEPQASGARESSLSPSKLWMSLSDRTRASISLTGHEGNLTNSNVINSHEQESAHEPTLPEVHEPSDNEQDSDDHHATLLERTRKSMSILSQHSFKRPRNNRPEKWVSQVYPVNQFETPGRPSRTSDIAPPCGSGASTPRDQLFDEDAEYSSIFKSRPKLAMSPAFSPDSSVAELGLGSNLGCELDRLDPETDGAD